MMDNAETEDELPDEEEETSEEQEIEKFLAKASRDFTADLNADRDNRKLAYEDIEFEAGNQWHPDDRRLREEGDNPRPVVTQNHLSTLIKQVTNELRLNKPAISYKPVETDDRAMADVSEGLTRHIEQRSDAARVYADWAEQAIICGIGHARINAIEEDEAGAIGLRIDHIEDPLAVVWDQSAVRRDRTDARRCFVIDYMPQEIADETFKDAIGEWPTEDDELWKDWYEEYDEVRVCELWKVATVEWTTFEVMDPETGVLVPVEQKAGDPPPMGGRPVASERRREVRWWIITAGKILDGGLEGNLWPGSYIPIFPVVGEEKRLGRKVLRKGLVRDAKDPQRLINWALSLIVEAMATAPKPKYIASDLSIEGYEEDWEQANTSNKAVLTYNHGKDKPDYVAPPIFPQGLLEAAQMFTEGLKRVTGIFDASIGAKSNETSGKAILQRERQGDVGTFHFIDGFSAGLRHMGRALVELLPKVYQAERMVRILGRDGQESIVAINQFDEATGQWTNRLSPASYDVIVESGPSFSTRREQAADGMLQLIQAFPQAAPVLSDLLAQMLDWPEADKVAMRLRALVPPQVLMAEQNGGEVPPPQPDPMQEAELAEKTETTRGKKLDNDEHEMRMRGFATAPEAQPAPGNGAAPNGAPAGPRVA